MRRPRFQIVEVMLVIAAAGFALGAAARHVRLRNRFDDVDGMIAAASLALVALGYRRLRPVLRRARLAELARRHAPPPRPAPLPRPDHAAFLESRAYRDVRTPRPLVRSRP